MKLFKLAWDMTGSEFAGRHLQYEKFYAGASFIIRNHSYRETDWAEFNGLVDKVMSGYDVPDAGKSVAADFILSPGRQGASPIRSGSNRARLRTPRRAVPE